jgi:uncharacterized membrane protein YheB (UPF0754 family)
MEVVLMILFMMVIGAMIGGLTNSLAIKMLFRPYRTYYIGKWRVPFTPGLIPKRRGELAEQLGRMVVDHLLTPDSLKKKLTDKAFQKEIQRWLTSVAEQWIQSEKPIEDVFTRFGFTDSKRKLHLWLERWTDHKIIHFIETNGDRAIKEVLPKEWVAVLDQKVQSFTPFIIQKLTVFFESDKGKEKIQQMVDDFLKERGMLGNMLQMFLGNMSLVDKIQPEITKFFQNDGTKHLISELIESEWNQMKDKSINEWLASFDHQKIYSSVKEIVSSTVQIYRMLDKPVYSVLAPYEKTILDVTVPSVVTQGTSWLTAKIENIIQTLRLQEIVKEQVESFSVERLEEMVLSISKKEFKMITYLGALLGGIIGLIQGLIVFFLT